MRWRASGDRKPAHQEEPQQQQQQQQEDETTETTSNSHGNNSHAHKPSLEVIDNDVDQDFRRESRQRMHDRERDHDQQQQHDNDVGPPHLEQEEESSSSQAMNHPSYTNKRNSLTTGSKSTLTSTTSTSTTSISPIEKSGSSHQQQKQRQQHNDVTTTASSSDDNDTHDDNHDDDNSNNDHEQHHAEEDHNDHDDNDDEGFDHALPDHPDTHQQQKGSTQQWQPQTQQSTCEFTHTIPHYSQKRESGCKKAEYSATTVDSFGNRWRLIVYVNGNGRASNHHLSLFLQVADADDLPFGWKKAVSYVLTLEHPTGPNMGYAKRNPDKTFKLCPKAIDWGWSQFITSDRIQQEGYIHNDTLIVRASVTVKYSSVSIDSEDAELYLKCAVEEGNASAVTSCLEEGASVNCQFKDDLYTPLHTACSTSNTSSSNTSDSNGAGSLEVLHLLLERGADGNACNKWRETPLLIAANNGHKAAVDLLLQNGADPSLCSEAGWSALTFAAHKGYDDIVSLLLNAGAPVNCRVTEDLSTPLHKSCAGGKSGHLSAVKQLLKGGADVHALNKWRETPLLTAANHGQASAVEALLKAGGDPCKCTDTGWSPLSIAAYKGHDDVVSLLLEEGAPTEEADPTLSALLQAATKGLPDTVELLLRHGADHTVTTKKGDTALSILVEQNLIDAAVEMVTEYKASVPRCSRDRKKVQRARLLINLRVKQQQREGCSLQLSTDDDETDQDESDDDLKINSALHDDHCISKAAAPRSTRKKKKKGGKQSAEAQARAAEEALLLELEQEESKAQKDEAAANSKRAKKKKKKERERHQKLKEEEQQRQKEDKKQKEIERQQRIKDEATRNEREQKAKEQKERDLREALQREKEAAVKRKDKYEREQRHREQEKKAQEKREVFERKTAAALTETIPILKSHVEAEDEHSLQVFASTASTMSTFLSSRAFAPPNNRGWETQNSTTATTMVEEEAREEPVVSSNETALYGTSYTLEPHAAGPSVEEDLENMATGVVDFLEFDSISNQAGAAQHANPAIQHSRVTNEYPVNSRVEHPAIVLCRQEKLAELFQRCALFPALNEIIAKTVVYRWIVRAAHDEAISLDPIIPSWTDFDALATFFQRQLISESRKGVGSTRAPGIANIETLKESGSSMAHLCHNLSKDVVQFRANVDEQLPHDWSDAAISVSASETMSNEGDSIIVVDWASRAQVYIPLGTFANVRDRYTGSPTKFLTTLFVAKKRYEAMRMVVKGTPMEFRLSSTTKAYFSRDAAVSVELCANPFFVSGSNRFFGLFPDVDLPFEGGTPFFNDDGSNTFLKKQGGSVLVLPPLDNMVAALYVRKIVDMLEEGDKEAIPLSFSLFLPSDCFRDYHRLPSFNDLHVLDPRLSERQGVYIRCAEILSPGQHTYQCGEHEGVAGISPTGSLFVVLQNNAGNVRFALHDDSIANILGSMSLNYVVPNDPPVANTMGYSDGVMAMEPSVLSQVNFQESIGSLSPKPDESRSEFGTIGVAATSNSAPNSSRRGGRRGRLFDLIDDGEDENTNDVDVMSGMLNNLNVDLFQSNLSSDIDIEAISLMGIGGAPINGPTSGEKFT